jgi:hypothetical protein
VGTGLGCSCSGALCVPGARTWAPRPGMRRAQGEAQVQSLLLYLNCVCVAQLCCYLPFSYHEGAAAARVGSGATLAAAAPLCRRALPLCWLGAPGRTMLRSLTSRPSHSYSVVPSAISCFSAGCA